ncbi:Cof-type HAD-IIB family hydrolase [Glutamicibacter sp. MNS18]|uniref:HAD family hydrolase n=1 Tax=Glutamicibacter sp. MNS18 TaxID=2989817 RepID=UPI0022359B80|nr:HAD family hydrolase [Glutamicibacter sp. MNS18]MCW4466707.1 Cof-type HAD-IIB family hydrolase [Glutamicibacter sp. MNS18]
MTVMTKTGNEDRLTNGKLMVCLDVDGTIVNHRGEMSQPVRHTARDVVAAGHEVVVSTGRSLGATLPVARELGIDRGYVVACNGGVIAKIAGTEVEVIHREVFDPSLVLATLWRTMPHAKYALENEQGEFLSSDDFSDASFGAPARVVGFDELVNSKAVRVVVFSTDATAEEFGQAVHGLGLSGVTYSVGWTAWLDIAAEGTTKASGLERLRGTLGFDSAATLAVGDGRNDIEMLQWAGTGVAMGQAPDEVKAAADTVTTSVDEDGLVAVLQGVLDS